MRRITRARGEQGAAAVEFAIVLPVLVAILMGTIDWGYYFFTREIVVNASREGARVGSLQFDTDALARAAATAAAQAYVESMLKGPATISIQTDVNSDLGACPARSSCVRITYDNGGAVTGFLGSLVPTSIVAYAEMRK